MVASKVLVSFVTLEMRENLVVLLLTSLDGGAFGGKNGNNFCCGLTSVEPNPPCPLDVVGRDFTMVRSGEEACSKISCATF